MATTTKTSVPAGAKQPTDRQAKAEARSEDVEFVVRDETFTIRRDAADDVEFLELLEEEKNMSAFKQLLGADLWARMKDILRDDHGKVRAAALDAALDAALNAIGGEGNSAASSGS